MARILTHIVEQHAEEAAFLWLLRDKAVDAPHYKRHHLARLDERVEAHVDGLRVAGEAGRDFAWTQLVRHGEAGEMFAAAVTLVETDNLELVAPYLSFAEEHPESLPGLVGAIAWAAPERLGSLVRQLLDSGSSLGRYLGVAACSVHRVDPYERLEKLIEDKEPVVRARALRLVGEMGRIGLTPQLTRIAESETDETAGYWASWSLALLTGAPRAIAELQRMAESSTPAAPASCDLALRLLPPKQAADWLWRLNSDPGRAHQIVVGIGVIGDPAAIPWLIEKMRHPMLARAAGESLSMITGVDLSQSDLSGPPPELAEARADLDWEESLPWPSVDKLEAWWRGAAKDWPVGQRHLLGKPVSVQSCEQAWLLGYQRQRRAAALELARLLPAFGVVNWRATERNTS